jgi:hypothetical protein
MKIAITLSVAAAVVMFVGCGGGSSSSSPTVNGGSSSSASSPVVKNGGIFVDAPVKGLSYKCSISGRTGKTDADGRYDCESGDSEVTFAIGSRNLGTTPIEDVITPRSFFNGTNRDDEILNLAQLLQTMDKDNNPDNGIDLDEDAIVNWQSNHTGFDNKDFDTLISQELGKTLVGELEAKNHLNSVLSSYGISGINPHITSDVGSSSSISSSAGSSSSVSVVDDTIDSAKLAGMTVVGEYKSGVKVKNIKKVSYIFLSSSEVITVFDLFDGTRKVARDSNYHQSNGNNVAILNPEFDSGDDFLAAFGISTDNGYDKITVGHSTAYPYTVTSIIKNSDNGIDEATVHGMVEEASSSSASADDSALSSSNNIMIYNNVSASTADELESQLNQNHNMIRYDSESAMHCPDYGFTTLMTEIPADNMGVNSKTYMKNNQYMCLEFDYSSSAKHGSSNMALYN